MGRLSKEAKAISKMAKMIKQPGYFTVVIQKDDKVIFSKRKLTKDEYLSLYLKNIEANITNHPEYTIDDIIKGYKNLWGKYIIKSVYTDSYGHKWNNTPLSDKSIFNRVSIIYNKLKDTHNEL